MQNLLGARKSRKVRNVDSKEKLDAIQLIAKSIKNDAVFLATRYGCGIDINFRKFPKVSIMCDKVFPKKHEFLQMAGRAQRGSNFPVCTVFSATGAGSEINGSKRIMTDDKEPMKQA